MPSCDRCLTATATEEVLDWLEILRRQCARCAEWTRGERTAEIAYEAAYNNDDVVCTCAMTEGSQRSCPVHGEQAEG